jgi:hypothetical protein
VARFRLNVISRMIFNKMSEEKIKGFRVFIAPGFLLTILMVFICFHWLDTKSISAIYKTAITVSLILLTIFIYTLVVRKIYNYNKDNN